MSYENVQNNSWNTRFMTEPVLRYGNNKKLQTQNHLTTLPWKCRNVQTTPVLHQTFRPPTSLINIPPLQVQKANNDKSTYLQPSQKTSPTMKSENNHARNRTKSQVLVFIHLHSKRVISLITGTSQSCTELFNQKVSRVPVFPWKLNKDHIQSWNTKKQLLRGRHFIFIFWQSYRNQCTRFTVKSELNHV